jgi:hypothetical protein
MTQLPPSSISEATVSASDISSATFDEKRQPIEKIREKLGVTTEAKQEPSLEIWILKQLFFPYYIRARTISKWLRIIPSLEF